jgi:hypothetical protein
MKDGKLQNLFDTYTPAQQRVIYRFINELNLNDIRDTPFEMTLQLFGIMKKSNPDFMKEFEKYYQNT